MRSYFFQIKNKRWSAWLPFSEKYKNLSNNFILLSFYLVKSSNSMHSKRKKKIGAAKRKKKTKNKIKWDLRKVQQKKKREEK